MALSASFQRVISFLLAQQYSIRKYPDKVFIADRKGDEVIELSQKALEEILETETLRKSTHPKYEVYARY